MKRILTVNPAFSRFAELCLSIEPSLSVVTAELPESLVARLESGGICTNLCLPEGLAADEGPASDDALLWLPVYHHPAFLRLRQLPESEGPLLSLEGMFVTGKSPDSSVFMTQVWLHLVRLFGPLDDVCVDRVSESGVVRTSCVFWRTNPDPAAGTFIFVETDAAPVFRCQLVFGNSRAEVVIPLDNPGSGELWYASGDNRVRLFTDEGSSERYIARAFLLGGESLLTAGSYRREASLFTGNC